MKEKIIRCNGKVYVEFRYFYKENSSRKSKKPNQNPLGLSKKTFNLKRRWRHLKKLKNTTGKFVKYEQQTVGYGSCYGTMVFRLRNSADIPVKSNNL